MNNQKNKLHYSSGRWTLCGSDSDLFTIIISDVTCETCKKEYRKKLLEKLEKELSCGRS